MLEQKIFFTRNGEYTLWEKISLNKKANLEKLKEELEDTFRITLGTDENFIVNNIYKFYQDSNKDEKLIIEEIIDANFCCDEKLDFNALLYKFDTLGYDLDTVNNKLDDLNNIINTYDEDDLNINKYICREKNTIDIRLRSNKNLYYKGSSNDQILNTEIRIYLDFGLIIMTDFSDYTHKKSIKNQLLDDISTTLTGNKLGVKECIMTDMTLRILLKRSKQNASKFKFSIEGLMNVDFNIVDGNSGNPLNYEHLKTFYEKHSLSLIKISMSNDVEKYITIDGNKGKLNSRAKNLQARDIDEFMSCLCEVMRYDYLNRNYINQIMDIAKVKLIMATISKRREVEDIYNSINEAIKFELEGLFDVDVIRIITNAFFYCLLNNIVPKSLGEENTEIDSSILRRIDKLFSIGVDIINSLYSDIIFLVKNKNEDILEELDRYIMYEGVEHVS